MIFKDWQDGFDAFCTAFDDYLSYFPEIGWHEPYVRLYRERIAAVRDGSRVNRPGSPFYELHCAVMLLLDGRKPLAAEQRGIRERMIFRWRQIERSAGAVPLGEGHRIQYPKGTYKVD